MFRYEIFRQSVVGWCFITSFVAFSATAINYKALSNSQWAIMFAAGLLSSPVFGYLVNQLIRAWYIWTGTRPNDTELDIKKLHSTFHNLIDPKMHGYTLTSLRVLPPKDLHRVLWVTFADKDLRDRSESYWERYYTNQGIIVSLSLGVVLSVMIFIFNTNFWSLTTLGKVCIIILIIIALIIDNRKYLQISTGIENAWISAFLDQIRDDPKVFNCGMFKLVNKVHQE